MNNEVVLPADAVKKEEPKAAVPKATMASKPKPAAKKARKAVKKAQQKTKKPAAKKLVQRRAFPYQQVLKNVESGQNAGEDHYLATEIAADHCAAPARRRNSGIRRLRGQQELPSRTKHPLFPD
jgi:hypothetical protein